MKLLPILEINLALFADKSTHRWSYIHENKSSYVDIGSNRNLKAIKEHPEPNVVAYFDVKVYYLPRMFNLSSYQTFHYLRLSKLTR